MAKRPDRKSPPERQPRTDLVECAYCEARVAPDLMAQHLQQAHELAPSAPSGTGYPVAPPRDIGTDQGAVRPDIPRFRAPRSR